MKKQLALVAALAALFAGSANAALLIDNFGQSQSLASAVPIGGGSDPQVSSALSLTGASTDLGNASRTLYATAIGAAGDAGLEENVKVLGPATKLSISNDPGVDGVASLYYTFDDIDFTLSGTAILLSVLNVDTGVSVEMVVNGSSTSGVQAFSGAGVFYKLYSDFSTPTAFNHVTSLELKFSGVPAWDGQFQLLSSNTPVIPPTPGVPEPATLGLLGLGLLGLGMSRRKRAA